MDANKKRISWFGQVKVYVGKCFRLFINEKQWKNFITTFILIFIIVIVTHKYMFRDFNDTRNGMFTIICGCIWVGLFNSIQSICRERAIIKREYRTGMKLSSYIAAHAIYEAFLCAVEAMIILIMMYIKDGINAKNDGLGSGFITTEGLAFTPFLDYYFTFFLVIFGADTMAMFVSSLVRKENTAMTIMPFVLIVQLVMSGAIFNLEGAMSKIANVTVSKWGLEAALRISNTSSDLFGTHEAVMKQLEYEKITGSPMPDIIPYHRWVLSPQFEGFNYEPNAGDLWAAWGVMLLMIAIFLIGSALILRLVDKDKRI